MKSFVPKTETDNAFNVDVFCPAGVRHSRRTATGLIYYVVLHYSTAGSHICKVFTMTSIHLLSQFLRFFMSSLYSALERLSAASLVSLNLPKVFPLMLLKRYGFEL